MGKHQLCRERARNQETYAAGISRRFKEKYNDRASRCIIIAVAVVGAVILFFLLRHLHLHTFTSVRWRTDPGGRDRMVGDLQKKHDLMGMTEEAVIALLGPEDSQQTTFMFDQSYHPPESTLVYACGTDALSMERQWLIVSLEDGIVVAVDRDYS